MRPIAIALLLTVVAGCRPAELRPLDYEPPPSARILYRFSPDRGVRYDGHWVHDSIGEQTAGDLEARVRVLAYTGGSAPPKEEEAAPRIELVTVSVLGTRGYYEALTKLIGAAKPDVIVAGLPLKGDETDPRRPRGHARDLDLDQLREILSLFPEITFPRDALPADPRCIGPQLTDADIAFIDSVSAALHQEITPEEKEDLRSVIEALGPDVVLHYVILAQLLGKPEELHEEKRVLADSPPLEDAPLSPPTFEGALAEARKLSSPERERAEATAFSRYRLSEACLEAMDLSVAAGARRVVFLALPDTAWGLSLRLKERGYTIEREEWLKAVPLLSEHKPSQAE